MVDCSKISCNGCTSGWPKAALDYVKVNGFTSEDEYQYLGYEHTCEYTKAISIGVLNQTFLVWTNGNETMLK
jgi:Papain family cysteine protease